MTRSGVPRSTVSFCALVSSDSETARMASPTSRALASAPYDGELLLAEEGMVVSA